MAGFDPHILDPYINERAEKMFSDADWFNNAMGKLYVNEPLGQIGRNELSKIQSGNYGGTMAGNAIRSQMGRSMRAAERDNSMGAAAMMKAGSTPGASLLYDRMLQKRKGDIEEQGANRLMQALPGMVGQAGQWAEAPNRNIAQQAAFRQMYDQARTNATKIRQSNFQYTKRSSFWDKLSKVANGVAGVAGSFFGMGGGNLFGGGGSGLSGGGPGPLGGLFPGGGDTGAGNLF